MRGVFSPLYPRAVILPLQGFKMNQYDIIYADPPWSYNDKMADKPSFSVSNQYDTQKENWLSVLPVQQIAANDCCLFMWVTSPMLPTGLKLMDSWGFKYKTVAFCWNKKTSKGNDCANLGRWTMGNVELCLLGTKGKPNKWRVDKGVMQLVKAKRTKHSKKPDEVRDRIVALLGDRPRIELFARDKKSGWDVWGNEIENDIEL